jgi:hypothetical protein
MNPSSEVCRDVGKVIAKFPLSNSQQQNIYQIIAEIDDLYLKKYHPTSERIYNILLMFVTSMFPFLQIPMFGTSLLFSWMITKNADKMKKQMIGDLHQFIANSSTINSQNLSNHQLTQFLTEFYNISRLKVPYLNICSKIAMGIAVCGTVRAVHTLYENSQNRTIQIFYSYDDYPNVVIRDSADYVRLKMSLDDPVGRSMIGRNFLM